VCSMTEDDTVGLAIMTVAIVNMHICDTLLLCLGLVKIKKLIVNFEKLNDCFVINNVILIISNCFDYL